MSSTDMEYDYALYTSRNECFFFIIMRRRMYKLELEQLLSASKTMHICNDERIVMDTRGDRRCCCA